MLIPTDFSLSSARRPPDIGSMSGRQMPQALKLHDTDNPAGDKAVVHAVRIRASLPRRASAGALSEKHI